MSSEQTTEADRGGTVYERRPEPIRAIRWTGDNIAEVQRFMDPVPPTYMAGFSNADDLIGLGHDVANKGDWILAPVDGSDFWHLEDAEFNRRYSAADALPETRETNKPWVGERQSNESPEHFAVRRIIEAAEPFLTAETREPVVVTGSEQVTVTLDDEIWAVAKRLGPGDAARDLKEIYLCPTCGWRFNDADAFCLGGVFGPAAAHASVKVEPIEVVRRDSRLTKASPVLGDEERERLKEIAESLEALKGGRLHDHAAFLRKLAQGEERDA